MWTHDIFPNWDNVRYSKRVKDCWTQGLPAQVRGKAWFLAVGNGSAITRELFELMAERGVVLRELLKEQSALEQKLIEAGSEVPKEFEVKPDPTETNFTILKALFKVRKKLKMLISMKPESKSREKSILIIDTDIPRTFSSVEGFQSDKNCADLAKVLRAFAMYRPDVGYVQGMSYVAGMLLMHM